MEDCFHASLGKLYSSWWAQLSLQAVVMLEQGLAGHYCSSPAFGWKNSLEGPTRGYNWAQHSEIPSIVVYWSFCIMLLDYCFIIVALNCAFLFHLPLNLLLVRLDEREHRRFLLRRYSFCSCFYFCSRSFEENNIESFLLIAVCNLCYCLRSSFAKLSLCWSRGSISQTWACPYAYMQIWHTVMLLQLTSLLR